MLVPGKRLTVFAIRNTERRGTVWVRLGTAYVNKDESLNIYLDALPLEGQLHCREAAAERPPAGMPPSLDAAVTEVPPALHGAAAPAGANGGAGRGHRGDRAEAATGGGL